MAHIVPAIKSKMGNTEYYQATMSAKDLVNLVRPAQKLDSWSQKGIEERMQREINSRRVLTEIVPYMVENEDRFFGSFVVLVTNPNVFEFQSVSELSSSTAVHSSIAKKLGWLNIDGGELIALDGQHRWKAFQEIINGSANTGSYFHDIPSDELSVIFVEYENDQKTRKIFNKINRHAKATSRSDNLITSEDDAAAIVSRQLIRDEGPLGMKDPSGDYIVNWRNNTISPRSTKLTTLGAVYHTTYSILEYNNFPDLKDLTKRPAQDDLDTMYDFVSNFWDSLLSSISGYKLAIENVQRIPSLRQMETRHPNGDRDLAESEYSLLFRPVGLESLVDGVLLAMKNSDEDLDLDEALFRANQIDWKVSASHWGGTIVRFDQASPDKKRINAGRASVRLASELVAYIIGEEYMSEEQLEDFKEKYLIARNIPSSGIFDEDLSTHVETILSQQAEELPV